MTHFIVRNVSILSARYGMAKDIARNLTGFSISGVFASLNTEFHDTLRLRPLLQRELSQAVKLPKVYDIQEWRVAVLLRYARLHRFSIIKGKD